MATRGHERGWGASSFIAGVFIQTKNKKMSIYDAMMRGILTPGTALVLLEAQAASGLLTDPASSKTMSVKEALAAGLIGRDFYEKLLSAEGAVTGYTEPYTGHKISLFQAMKKEFIVKAHAVRLLEAQIATGGIIDPAHGHRIPVDVACQQGYFDQEMSQFLSNPKNQTRSCFDPNTHENLTYTQLLRRCIPDPDTGLLMLHLMDKGSVLYQLSKEARKALQAARTTVGVGLFQGQSVTAWELLFSRYVPDRRREELLRKYKAGTVAIPEIITILTTIITSAEMENRDQSSATATPSNEEDPQGQDPGFQEHHLRKSLKSAIIFVTAGELKGEKMSLLDVLFSKHIPQGLRQDLLGLYRAGILTTEQVAAVVTTIINQTEAANRALMANARSPHKEAARAEQSGDGFSTEDAELDKILQATRIDLVVGELQGRQVSLWDLLHSKHIPEENRQQLLELYRSRGLTLEQMVTVVTTVIKKKDPMSRKIQVTAKTYSRDTGKAAENKDAHSPKEEPWKRALKTTTLDLDVGEFRGQEVSVWDVLHSSYIPEEKRQELLELYCNGTLTLERLMVVLSILVKKKDSTSRKMQVTVKSSSKDTEKAVEDKNVHSAKEEPWKRALKTTTVELDVGEFRGHKVSVWDLLHCKYIPKQNREELLELYEAGELSLEQVRTVVSTIVSKAGAAGAERSASASAAGEERTSTAAAECSHVQQDGSWEQTLRSTTVQMALDESQGRQVSLWDLLHSSYIPEEKRQELLELYCNGTLTLERLMVVLSTLVKKKDSTSRKMQVTVKISSKDTEKAAEDKDTYSSKEEARQRALKTATLELDVGEFRGQEVSVWDLLHSSYIAEEKRQELLELYCNGTLTLERLMVVLSTLVKKKESTSRKMQVTVKSSSKDTEKAVEDKNVHSPKEEPWKRALKTTTVELDVGEFRGHKVSVWDLLHSKYIPRQNREELLELYEAGELTLEQVRTIVSTIVSKAGAAGAERSASASAAGEEGMTAAAAERSHGQQDGSWEQTLRSTTVQMALDESQGRQVSLWDVLHSSYIPEEKRQELLELYCNGTLPLERLMVVLSTLVKKKDSTSRKMQVTVKTSSKDTEKAAEDKDTYSSKEEARQRALKTATVDLDVGEFRGQEVSVWDLLHSSYVAEEKRQELLELYCNGTLPLERLMVVLSTLVKKKDSTTRKMQVTAKTSSKDTETAAKDKDAHSPKEEPWKSALKTTTVDQDVGEFRGHKVSVWDLLHSRSIPEEKRQELLERYRDGALPMQELLSTLCSLAARSEEQPSADLPEQIMDLLQTEGSYITLRPFQGQRVSVWELLSTKQLCEYQREAHLDSYGAGGLTVNEITITTTVVTGSRRGKGRGRRH